MVRAQAVSRVSRAMRGGERRRRSYDIMQVAVNGVSGKTTRARERTLICAPHPETLLKRSKGPFSQDPPHCLDHIVGSGRRTPPSALRMRRGLCSSSFSRRGGCEAKTCEGSAQVSRLQSPLSLFSCEMAPSQLTKRGVPSLPTANYPFFSYLSHRNRGADIETHVHKDNRTQLKGKELH